VKFTINHIKYTEITLVQSAAAQKEQSPIVREATAVSSFDKKSSEADNTNNTNGYPLLMINQW
jgi:hypothetical protein